MNGKESLPLFRWSRKNIQRRHKMTSRWYITSKRIISKRCEDNESSFDRKAQAKIFGTHVRDNPEYQQVVRMIMTDRAAVTEVLYQPESTPPSV
jgi:hypothetical protein